MDSCMRKLCGSCITGMDLHMEQVLALVESLAQGGKQVIAHVEAVYSDVQEGAQSHAIFREVPAKYIQLQTVD